MALAVHREVIPQRLRRAALLGRSRGATAGATAARQTVKGAGTLVSTVGSVALRAVAIIVLSIVGLCLGIFLLMMVGCVSMLWVSFILSLPPLALGLALLMIATVTGFTLVYRRLPPP